MIVRVLTNQDVEIYRELRLRGLQTEPSAFGSTYEIEVKLPVRNFEERLTPSTDRFVVGGFDGEQLVCVASFVRSTGPKSNHKGSLQAMYCDKQYRGTGIARDVVNDLINRVEELEGVKQVTLAVVAENTRAFAFYQSFGFEVFGTEPKAMFDGEKYYDEHKMILHLRES